MRETWSYEAEFMQWKIVGFAVGALLGSILILSVRMPFYLSLPVMVGLTLAGGKLSEAIASKRKQS